MANLIQFSDLQPTNVDNNDYIPIIRPMGNGLSGYKNYRVSVGNIIQNLSTVSSSYSQTSGYSNISSNSTTSISSSYSLTSSVSKSSSYALQSNTSNNLNYNQAIYTTLNNSYILSNFNDLSGITKLIAFKQNITNINDAQLLIQGGNVYSYLILEANGYTVLSSNTYVQLFLHYNSPFPTIQTMMRCGEGVEFMGDTQFCMPFSLKCVVGGGGGQQSTTEFYLSQTVTIGSVISLKVNSMMVFGIA